MRSALCEMLCISSWRNAGSGLRVGSSRTPVGVRSAVSGVPELSEQRCGACLLFDGWTRRGQTSQLGRVDSVSQKAAPQRG